MNKKGQIGLDTAKTVMLALMAIGVFAFVMILLLVNLDNTQVAATSGADSVNNETTGFVNSTGYTVARGTTLPDFNLQVSQIRNITGAVVPAAEYTVNSNTGVITNATARTYFNVQIDYSYTYNQFTDTSTNITTGVEDFFNNATTWFALLAIVVIILIIAIVIFAVNRFGGNRVNL